MESPFFFNDASRFSEHSGKDADTDLYNRLKWLVFIRTLFIALLLVSTVALHLGDWAAEWSRPLLFLYGFIAVLFFLSLLYSLLLKNNVRFVWQAYFQIFVDTVSVSVIIFLTGNFSSLFSFLYLVVVIYSSILLFRKGSMIMAAVCAIQYGVLVDLEFYGIIQPFGITTADTALGAAWSYVLYRVMVLMVACFAVAFLSGLLAEQARKSKKELLAMESHVKRVEKMAAVGEMAAGLAHEIKNPLASLSGSVQLMKEEIQCDAEHTMLMDIVLREADRLSSLVSNFLLFAKPPVGQNNILELKSFFSDTISIFKKNALFKDTIEISQNVAPDIFIDIDEGHLRQILWNLLLNAADSLNNKGLIDIAVYPDRKYAVIDIRDTGCGIPKEQIQYVFDPFYTTKPEGTGLGLSIVHRIIESYHGWLSVDSTLGEGTTISIRFPLADSTVSRQHRLLKKHVTG